MFEAIHALAKHAPLSLLITTVGENLRLIVIPGMQKDANTEEASKNGLTEPISLEGTPKELDEQFVHLLTTYTRERGSLLEQLEVTTTVLKASKEKAAKEATKSLAKSGQEKASTNRPSTSAQVPSAVDEMGEDDVSGDARKDPGGDDSPSLSGNDNTANVTASLTLF